MSLEICQISMSSVFTVFASYSLPTLVAIPTTYKVAIAKDISRENIFMQIVLETNFWNFFNLKEIFDENFEIFVIWRLVWFLNSNLGTAAQKNLAPLIKCFREPAIPISRRVWFFIFKYLTWFLFDAILFNAIFI